MKSLLIVVCAFACAYANAVSDSAAQVLRSDSQHNPEGNFHYSFETDNGIAASADGKLKNVGKDEVALEIVGSNQFVAPDGQAYQISYIADENGFQPQGAHLPTPPAPVPIPEYIVRSLEYIAAHPQTEEPFQRAG